MSANEPKKSSISAVPISMLKSIGHREHPLPFDLQYLNEKLEEIDPGGKEAMKSAIKMYNE